mmetsp:Transcript_26738/g.58839  ORF Transcript_26738/g.58839 Transcript_26738/m.58839 type:complete len:92 (-) Transcript_26738:727-1002(-)
MISVLAKNFNNSLVSKFTKAANLALCSALVTPEFEFLRMLAHKIFREGGYSLPCTTMPRSEADQTIGARFVSTNLFLSSPLPRPNTRIATR